jgi:hypothetical protein
VRYHFTSVEGWRAANDAGELSAADTLTNDPNLPLHDGTRVRISVGMRRDAKRFVTVHAARWFDVVDHVDNSIQWSRPIPVCGPSRAMMLESPQRAGRA